jgi:hypothetical protein
MEGALEIEAVRVEAMVRKQQWAGMGEGMGEGRGGRTVEVVVEDVEETTRSSRLLIWPEQFGHPVNAIRHMAHTVWDNTLIIPVSAMHRLPAFCGEKVSPRAR